MPGTKTYFASDFHLGARYIENPLDYERRIVRWRDSIKADAGTLYLLGDILDYWYEYRYVVPRGFTRIFGKLAELSASGVDIHWLIGNHDIWIFDYLPHELGITLHDGRYPAMLLCNAILGGGEQNRLYTVIRGEQSLCYEAGSWYDGHKGILCAEAGCDFADLPAVEAAILQQVGALAAGDFSQQELDTARAGLLSDLRAMHDSPGRLDEFLTGRASENLPQDPDALAAALRRVTKEDVRQAAAAVTPDTVCTLEEDA